MPEDQRYGADVVWIGKLRDECLNEEVFASLAEARAVIGRWRRDYNQIRPHSAHAGLTPDAAHLRSAGARLRNPVLLAASVQNLRKLAKLVPQPTPAAAS